MITLNSFKRFLDISADNTSKDKLLNDCISSAVGELNCMVNRELDYKLHKETINGSGNKFGYLANFPVISINVLQESTAEGLTDIVLPPDNVKEITVLFDAGIIFLKKGYIFPHGEKNIYVEYESGFAAADAWEANIKYYVNELRVFNNIVYICIEEHIAGDSFDRDKWEEYAGKPAPADIEKAVKYLAAKIFYESPAGKSIFMKRSEGTGGNVPKSIVYKEPDLERIINSYKKLNS